MIKELLTKREKAIQFINSLPEEYFIRLVVRSHDNVNHEWIEVQPDGSVNEAEEPDNNTTHWIKYPDKEVAAIYNIHDESAEPCNCDVCTMYRHFEYFSKEEFIERYNENDWNYCNDATRAEAILEDADSLSKLSIQDTMIDGIKSIEYGYFDDETKNE